VVDRRVVAVVVSALLQGFKGYPGAVRLALMRWLGLLVCTAPAQSVAEQSFNEALAGHPSEGGAIHLEHFMTMVDGGGGAWAGATAVGLLLFLLWDQLLTATAITLVDVGAAPGQAQPWTILRDDGWRRLPAFLRVAVLTIGAQLAVAGLAGKVVGKIQVAGTSAEWTGDTLNLLVPALAALAVAVLWSLIGGVSFMARVLIVVDDRRRVLRALYDALRVSLRPGWLLVFAAVTLTFQLLTGWLLSGSWPGPFAAWVLVPIAHSWLWVALCRALHDVYADGRFAGVRETADDPLPIVGRPWAWTKARALGLIGR
jgi:lysylphosphatidylglycerol synthetase-like protein (DUF2156 family)